METQPNNMTNEELLGKIQELEQAWDKADDQGQVQETERITQKLKPYYDEKQRRGI